MHELKHDGYRLQIHVRDGRVKLYTMNGAVWAKRYPRIVEQAAKIKGSAIIDAEVVWLDTDGIAQFDALHSRVMDHAAVACAFDLLMLNGDDLRRKPLAERKATLRKVLRRTKGGIQYVEHVEGDGAEMFAAVCRSWLGLAWLGLAWLGLAWLGLAWLGLAWLGLAWLGLAWLGLAWLGLAWLGLAWLGLAWLGLAWLGLAWLGLEGIVSKRIDAPYRSGPSKSWIKVKNPKAPAATRALLMENSK